MHLHGHNFFVLAEGQGTWDGKITNYPATQRRDVQIIQQAKDFTTPSYLVIQYDTDNPGVWPFHCHIAWHVSAGLYINAMEHPDKIKQKVIPQVSCPFFPHRAVFKLTPLADPGSDMSGLGLLLWP